MKDCLILYLIQVESVVVYVAHLLLHRLGRIGPSADGDQCPDLRIADLQLLELIEVTLQWLDDCISNAVHAFAGIKSLAPIGKGGEAGTREVVRNSGKSLVDGGQSFC